MDKNIQDTSILLDIGSVTVPVIFVGAVIVPLAIPDKSKLRYEFVYLRQSTPPTYQILPDLILSDTERSIQLLQVLKAICKLQN